MTCNWKSTYKELAVKFDATLSDRPNDVAHIYNCLIALIELTTIPDGSEECYGREAVTTLLNPMDLFYRIALRHYSYLDERWNMVKKINDFTELYFGNLTSFVESIDWDYDCVPYYWAQLCEETGFDTSGWNVCS